MREAERVGLAKIYETAEVDELMSLARAARFAGRGDVVNRALTSCRKRFPGHADAAMAAFLLGRSAPPAEAAQWFATYLREQPHGALAPEAAGRLIESYQAAGDTSAAQNAASQYLNRYPSGPHAAYARRVLGN
jgi:TolA-binding protein